jgi:hypothetical protein
MVGVRIERLSGGRVRFVSDAPVSRRLLIGLPIFLLLVAASILGSVYSTGSWREGLEVVAILAVLNAAMVYGRRLILRRGARQRQ